MRWRKRQAVHPHLGFEHCRHALQGRTVDAVFDEDTPITPSPARVARVALNEFILAHRDKSCRPVIICPSLIYGVGLGANPDSVQVPIKLARKRGNAAHAGPGENIWSNVHIDDLVPLYALAIEKAPTAAFYFAENGENSMVEVCETINRMLGFAGQPTAMSMAEAAAEWGEGTTEDTMASNSRVRAKRARQLGWKPTARSLIEEIEQGCYRAIRISLSSLRTQERPIRRGPSILQCCSTTSRNDNALWLWVPAFAQADDTGWLGGISDR